MALSDPGQARHVIDTGTGTTPGKVTLSAACYAGDVLGCSSGVWVKANAVTGGVIQGRLVALRTGASGDTIPVSVNPVIGGYSGGTLGNVVYVSEATAGEIEDAIPTDGGDATTIIGVSLSTTEVQFFLNSRADSTV